VVSYYKQTNFTSHHQEWELMTTTGLIVFCSVLVGGVGIALWALSYSYRAGRKTGEATVTAEEAEELLARAEEKQEAEREIQEAQRSAPDTAADRLRGSKWNRDI
jgi:hypothetical protein